MYAVIAAYNAATDEVHMSRAQPDTSTALSEPALQAEAVMDTATDPPALPGKGAWLLKRRCQVQCYACHEPPFTCFLYIYCIY